MSIPISLQILIQCCFWKHLWGSLPGESLSHTESGFVLSCLHQPPLGITQSLPEGLSGQPLSGGVKKSILSFLLQDSKGLGLVIPFLSRVIENKGGSCWWGWLWLRFQERGGCRVPLQSTFSNPAPPVGNQIKLKATFPCENKEYAHGWRISWVFSLKKLRLQRVRWMNGVHTCPRWVRT